MQRIENAKDTYLQSIQGRMEMVLLVRCQGRGSRSNVKTGVISRTSGVFAVHGDSVHCSDLDFVS